MPAPTPLPKDVQSKAEQLIGVSLHNLSDEERAEQIAIHIKAKTIPRTASIMVIRRLKKLFFQNEDPDIDHLLERIDSLKMGS